MTVLRVIVDNLFTAVPDDTTRYTRELTAALIRTAPDACSVQAVTGTHSAESIAEVRAALPGLEDLIQLPASSAQLALAWNVGIPPRMLPDGLTHSPTTLAPLFAHNRRLDPGVQTVVTVHSARYWDDTADLSLTARARVGRLLRRIERFADAVVVPRHSVAEILDERTTLGDRIQVIPMSPSRTMVARGPVATRATELGCPAKFLLTYAAEGETNLRLILAAVARADAGVPVIVAGRTRPGDTSIESLRDQAGLTAEQVLPFAEVDEESLAVLNTRALALIALGNEDSSGLSLFDAMVARTPVIYAGTPDMLEITGGAGLPVSADSFDLVDQLTQALTTVTTDREQLRVLQQEGADRARSFTWEDSARAVWALHAEL